MLWTHGIVIAADKRALSLRVKDFATARKKSLDIAYNLLTQHPAATTTNNHGGGGARGDASRGVGVGASARPSVSAMLLQHMPRLRTRVQPAGIPIAAFRKLLHELGDYGHSSSQALDLEAAVAALDTDGDGFVSRLEFRELCERLPLSQHEAALRTRRHSASTYSPRLAVKDDQRTCTMRLCPGWVGGPTFRSLRWLVHSQYFERCMYGLICLNTLVIFAELRFEYEPEEHGWFFVSWWEAVELCFTLLYNAEMAAKMIVHGFKRYWRSWRNTFDGTISLGSLATELVLVVPWIYNDPALIRFIMFARFLRILRLLNSLPQFHNIFATFCELVPAFSRLVSVLFLIMCAFGQVAIPAFGGKIYEGAHALNGTTFAESKYFANNFNDFGSAMVTLFELLLVNNWFVIMDAGVAVSGSEWARLFFILYYVVAVVVVFNLVVAHVLEQYKQQVKWSLAALEAEFGPEEVLRAQEVFEAADTDGSGKVNAKELRELLKKLGQTPSEAEVEEMIAEIDGDNDGVLSEQEFIMLLSHRSTNRYMALLRQHGGAVAGGLGGGLQS